MNFLKRWTEQGRRARQLRRANDLKAQGDFSAALAEYEAVYQQHPQDKGTLREIAELRAELGQVAQAVEALCALLEADVEEMPFIGNTAFDSLRGMPEFRRVYETLITKLREYLARKPNDATATLHLAEAYELLGDAEGAHAVYAELIQHTNLDVQARAHYAQARLYASMNEVVPAMASLRSAIEAAVGMVSILENDPAFDTLREMPEFQHVREYALERSSRALRDAIEAEPQNPQPYRNLVELLLSQGEVEEAIALSEQACDRIPSDLSLMELHANALFEGKRDTAMDAYQDILRINPNHAWALYRTGVLYEGRKNESAAREAFWDALNGVRNEVELAYLLARGFARLQETEGALAAFEMTVQLSMQSERLGPAALLAYLPLTEDFASLRCSAEFQAMVRELQELAESGGVEGTPYDSSEAE